MKKKKLGYWTKFFIKSITLSTLFTAIVPSLAAASTAASVLSPYLYNFNSSGSLVEAGDASVSTSKYWWVNSGAYMKISEGSGKTVAGSLSSQDPWRVIYAANNPTDTDSGYHPQNIFRLVTRSEWLNFEQEAYFNIKKDNLSSSSNRNQSNGLLLFNRYENDQNLYYTGVRVDGSAIIKKKKNGTYYTMAEVKGVFPGTYDRSSKPNLLPKNTWLGLKSQVKNLTNGRVEIKLYIDKDFTGKWQQVASVIDDGRSYGGSAITSSAYAGIRTDFMDVEFENFRIKSI